MLRSIHTHTHTLSHTHREDRHYDGGSLETVGKEVRSKEKETGRHRVGERVGCHLNVMPGMSCWWWLTLDTIPGGQRVFRRCWTHHDCFPGGGRLSWGMSSLQGFLFHVRRDALLLVLSFLFLFHSKTEWGSRFSQSWEQSGVESSNWIVMAARPFWTMDPSVMMAEDVD